nr:LysR substrate-binding domain-containing protein [Pseudenhygromyxa sp. WMMC2535]
MPSVRWLKKTIAAAEGEPPTLVVSHSLLTMTAAIAGAGLVLLPQYAGDNEAQLTRVGEPFDALAMTSWLVCHASARRLPRVRWTRDTVGDLLTPWGS